jgi:hypothetical protein
MNTRSGTIDKTPFFTYSKWAAKPVGFLPANSVSEVEYNVASLISFFPVKEFFRKIRVTLKELKQCH